MHAALTPPAWWEAQWDTPDDFQAPAWLLTDSDGFQEYIEPADLEHAITNHYSNTSFTLELCV